MCGPNFSFCMDEDGKIYIGRVMPDLPEHIIGATVDADESAESHTAICRAHGLSEVVEGVAKFELDIRDELALIVDHAPHWLTDWHKQEARKIKEFVQEHLEWFLFNDREGGIIGYALTHIDALPAGLTSIGGSVDLEGYTHALPAGLTSIGGSVDLKG